MRVHVVRATTEKLEALINDAYDQTDVETHQAQWLGGRDWVVIFKHRTAAHVPPAVYGWVAADERSHVRYDEHIAEHGQYAADIHPMTVTALIDPEVEWGNIRYGRYSETRMPDGFEFTGWIEDHARSWIIFLGAHGAPSLYWPRRDAEGGVIGSPFKLGA